MMICRQGIMVHEVDIRCFQVRLIEWLFNEWLSVQLRIFLTKIESLFRANLKVYLIFFKESASEQCLWKLIELIFIILNE